MTFLLDTCTFVWLCAEPQQLSETAKSIIDAVEATLFVSDASALELTLKWKAGKIDLPDPPRLWFEQQLAAWGLECRALTREDIYRTGELPEYHRDPFDRLLVAIAINRGATILTPDSAIRRYPVGTRW